MAIYHMSVKIISRSSGRTSVGAAAYRSGEKITNERDGLTHDYTRKTGIVHSEVVLCKNAPNEWQDRGKLWNAVEQVEKSSKAQVSREIEIALPKELSREEQIKLTHDYVKNNFVNKGMCADVNIHDKNDGNPHAHIMLTMRSVNQNGEWEAKQKKIYELDREGNKIYDSKKKTYKCTTQKTNDWDNQENVEAWRQEWAKECNEVLERNRIGECVDHRSYERQGIEKSPTVHIGSCANQIEKRGEYSRRGNINRAIEVENMVLEEVKAELLECQKEKESLLNAIKNKALEEKQEVNSQGQNSDIQSQSMTNEEIEQGKTQIKNAIEGYYESEHNTISNYKEYKDRYAASSEKVQNLEQTEKELYVLRDKWRNIEAYNTRIKELKAERESLGIFKGKQKKELTERIEEIKRYRERTYGEVKEVTDREFENSKELKEYIERKENRVENAYRQRDENKTQLIKYKAEYDKVVGKLNTHYKKLENCQNNRTEFKSYVEQVEAEYRDVKMKIVEERTKLNLTRLIKSKDLNVKLEQMKNLKEIVEDYKKYKEIYDKGMKGFTGEEREQYIESNKSKILTYMSLESQINDMNINIKDLESGDYQKALEKIEKEWKEQKKEQELIEQAKKEIAIVKEKPVHRLKIDRESR